MRYARRAFLRNTALATAGLAIPATPALAQAYRYKFGISLPASHPITVATVEFANAVRHDTGGRLDIKVFPDSQLGGDSFMFQQLRSGALEMYMSSGDILSTVVPATGLDHIGFAFPDDRRARAAMNGELGAYIRGELKAKNIIAFDTVWDGGFRQITTSTHPIRTVADMAGLKIRVPGAPITADFFKALGATPTAINASEMYAALQTHLVDAMEGTFINILTFKTFEVQKYLSVTNHQWTGFWLVINPDAWKALPADIQTIVERNARIAGAEATRSVALQSDSVRDLLSRDGLAINAVDTAPFRAPLAAYYAHWKSEFGPTVWGLLEKYTGPLG